MAKGAGVATTASVGRKYIHDSSAVPGSAGSLTVPSQCRLREEQTDSAVQHQKPALL